MVRHPGSRAADLCIMWVQSACLHIQQTCCKRSVGADLRTDMLRVYCWCWTAHRDASRATHGSAAICFWVGCWLRGSCMADDLAMLIHLWNCAVAPSRTSGCRHGDMHPHLCADMGTQELVIKARKEIKDSEDSLIRSEKLVAQAIEVIKGVGVKDYDSKQSGCCAWYSRRPCVANFWEHGMAGQPIKRVGRFMLRVRTVFCRPAPRQCLHTCSCTESSICTESSHRHVKHELWAPGPIAAQSRPCRSKAVCMVPHVRLQSAACGVCCGWCGAQTGACVHKAS